MTLVQGMQPHTLRLGAGQLGLDSPIAQKKSASKAAFQNKRCRLRQHPTAVGQRLHIKAMREVAALNQ